MKIFTDLKKVIFNKNRLKKIGFKIIFFPKKIHREAQNSVRLGDLSEAEKMKNLSDQFELLNEAFK